MPEVRLDDADAAELTEMLQFLTGWLARDPSRLAASLEELLSRSWLPDDVGLAVYDGIHKTGGR